MGKDGLLNKIKLKPHALRKAGSTYSIVPSSELTEGALEVWRALPEIIRDDPSLASFREQHFKLHGKCGDYFCAISVMNLIGSKCML